ncbi:enoyl-CoA hydratase/isomerase family protein [Azospirillum brasilense]|uniref:enoyl-CoA hydratase/isomerase family protein n=1 Tax=Azospirillum brasilense TaxID=192 RepID=UPI000E6860B6|nr:enoyl-CoA hydratase/isomerase family protein [Azospirillum brasilense]NUB12383.1 enoyl-CoA hydratase/isomerase family protein [Azospirillum brasilense]NUB27262.1 enoyl-CoA hydratase/isomerase family protein [Azospirillum brasilense]NUB35720.1 enoyl-CoA hydratase/isomerase family protein [Azospirillum brasilense]RIW01157.1 enoyl-CoA hydratase/isomerase family protein [Azospirillum brasilense]
MPEISTRTEGAIRILTISNERKRNAFEGTMAADFLRLLNEAESDGAVRVIVVTGAGDIAFSSGHDLNEIASGAHAESNLGEEPFLRPRSMRKPVIAAINGHCYAAALIFALSCDLRVASKNAAFGSPGARLGMLPEGGQIGRLPRQMAPARALELMLTASPLPADEAYRTGFINRLAEKGEALNEALVLARAIASNSPSVVAAIKAGVILGEVEGVEPAAAYEATVARQLEKEADAREGVSAFLEKRAPVFRGGK